MLSIGTEAGFRATMSGQFAPPITRCAHRRASWRLASGRGCLVLLSDAGREPPAFTDLDAVLFGPGPHFGAVPAGRRRTPRPGTLPAAVPAGVIDKRCQLRAEPARVHSAQVNLILRRTEAEPHRLLRRAAVEIVFESDHGPGRHL